MSAVAVSGALGRRASFYQTTVGKKAVMAVTGLLLFGFLLAHMAGNLQFFLGPEKLNTYAENLHHLGPILWAMRLGLLGAALLHIGSSISLARTQRLARPVGYAKRHN